jgi:hypothetical protein
MADEWMLLPVNHPVLLGKGVGGEDREERGGSFSPGHTRLCQMTEPSRRLGIERVSKVSGLSVSLYSMRQILSM